MENEFTHPAPDPRGRKPGFSVTFTRLLLIVCVMLFGVIVGMKVSDYFHGRYFQRRSTPWRSKPWKSRHWPRAKQP